MNTKQHTFTVAITFDPTCNCYLATCDAIPLATEASSVDALIERVRLIAPEIVELNGLQIAPKNVRLSFVYADVEPVTPMG